MLNLFKNQFFWLALILILAFIVRIYKIDSPVADWHSWRQVDTASVTRNFIKEGFNPFFPKYDDMSGVSENPIANLNRFRFVEFPVYNIAVYPLYLIYGIDIKYDRLVSILFSLGSIVFLYLICKRYLGVAVSLLTAAIYALLPFNVFFSRTTLPEPTFLFFALGMVCFVDRWIWEGGGKWGFWGFIFTAIAFLIKPWAIFFVPPLIYSLFVKYGSIKKIPKSFILFAVLSLMPFILWRFWILNFPEGIPASSWLMNGDGIRFRPAFWWWIVSERIGREILGVTGAFLFFLGLIMRPRNGSFFLHVWALAMFLYFVIFATGNVRHDYYQFIFTPIASVFVSLGFVSLIKGANTFLPRIWTILLATLFLILTFYFTWTQVKELYKINNPPIIEAGKFADQILPKEAMVVAPYNGDTAFLYQINRPGWAVEALPLMELVTDYGVTHYISVNRDNKTNWVLRHFKILEDNPRFVIADLRVITNPLTPEDSEP
ncbi:MAG: Uncharacterized protein G01um10147_436 [Microgenomates group bacterium Gr01-1014_7]|nr:MAG: Uncharacterized protein G01um10147_436 [Microgenomates group bacterium Gr01-1014_7]